MQQELFHEDFRSALEHQVKELGGYQAVAAELWPAKPLRAAEIRLRDCLNPDRDHKLAIEEIAAIMRMGAERGVHCAMHQLCDDLGYARPDIAPAKTEKQVLAEQLSHHVTEVARLTNELAATERNGE